MSFFPSSASTPLEGTFTNWNTLVVDIIPVAGTGATSFQVYVDNKGNSIIIDFNNHTLVLVTSTGTVTVINDINTSNATTGTPMTSILITYFTVIDTITTNIHVYTKNGLLYNIPVDQVNKWQSITNIAVAVSPNGKYIMLYGIDVSGTASRLQVYSGS